uniref:WD repeat domain 21 n=1 Tax=Eptatretus burgeri TaxID=7764 RepID=A0A8C4QTF1_EPTBU
MKRQMLLQMDLWRSPETHRMLLVSYVFKHVQHYFILFSFLDIVFSAYVNEYMVNIDVDTMNPSVVVHIVRILFADLPGFYYDPERNRYFRLLPGHNNFNPLTNSSLRRQQQEKERLKMVEEDNRCHPKVSDSRCTISRLVERRRVGLQGPQSYCRLMHELKISGMRKQSVEVTGAESDVEAFKLIKADSRCERLFALYDLGPGFCKYGLMTLDWKNRSAQAQLWYNHYFTNRMVKSVCWASLTGQDSHLLLSLMGYVDTSGCVSLLPASLFLPDDHAKRPGQVYNFKQMAFTCAWSRCPQIDHSFSAGCPRKAMVMDIVTTQQQHFHTLSDVLAQCFATQAPLLYSGSRSGEVWRWDLRQRSRLGPKPFLFRLSSAATSLSLLSDENYIVAADMAGKVCHSIFLES